MNVRSLFGGIYRRYHWWEGGLLAFVKLCSIASRSHILPADWLTVMRFVQSQSRSGCARPLAGMAEARGRIPRMRRWQPLRWGQNSPTILCWNTVFKVNAQAAASNLAAVYPPGRRCRCRRMKANGLLGCSGPLAFLRPELWTGTSDAGLTVSSFWNN